MRRQEPRRKRVHLQLTMRDKSSRAKDDKMKIGNFTDLVPKYSKQYTTAELLELALTMLDTAASEQRGKKQWLSHNLTLEVIRHRVHNPLD